MILAHLPAVSRNTMFALMLAGSLLLPQAPATADIFKWVNENNEVQYTQMAPPAGIKYTRIQTREHPDMVQPKSSEESPAGETDGVEARKQKDAEAVAAYEAEVARISKQNCSIAKNNLDQLNAGGHLRYRNEEGEYVTMKEEERQQRIAEASKQIEQFCKADSQ